MQLYPTPPQGHGYIIGYYVKRPLCQPLHLEKNFTTFFAGGRGGWSSVGGATTRMGVTVYGSALEIKIIWKYKMLYYF